MPERFFQRFLSVYGLELRLTCLHWSYGIAVTLWSGFVLITYTQNDFASLSGLTPFVTGFASLIALFLTGLQASRVKGSRFDAVEDALPTGVEALLARWLSTITAVGGLWVAPAIVLAVAPAGWVNLTAELTMAGLSLLSISFATGLIWLVYSTMGIRRWMYPLFALLWVASGMLPNMLSVDGLPVPGVNLLGFVMISPSSSSLWGWLPQGPLPLLMVLFYLGIVLLFAGLMIRHTIASRFYRHSWWATLFSLSALILVLGSGLVYTAQVSALNQQVQLQNQQVEQNADDQVLPAETPFIVTAYDLTFTPGTPARLSAVIEVRNRSDVPLDELRFSLFDQFEVIEASVPYQHSDHQLVLTLSEPLDPGTTRQIRIGYEGNITYLERQLGRPPEAAFFLDPRGVYLTCDVLWYPVPGSLLPSQMTYRPDSAWEPQCLLDSPARFRLTIQGEGGLDYVSSLTPVDTNTFESNAARWAMLVGAPDLQMSTQGAVTLIASTRRMESQVAQVEQYYRPAFDHLQRFFPQMRHLTVVTLNLPRQYFSSWVSYPATSESVIVVVDPQVFTWLPLNRQNQYDYIGAPIVTSIFGRSTRLTENVAYFLWLHYQTDGDPDALHSLLISGLPTEGSGSRTFHTLPYEERYAVAFALADRYAVQGEADLIALLRRMEAELEVLVYLPTDQLTEWIREAPNGG